MNSFLELYSSSDYLTRNRDYYKSTWEFIKIAADYLIPFQWTGGTSADYNIFTIDTDDNETDITGKFFGSTLLTGWTLTGTGTWTVSSDVVIVEAADTDSGDEIESNEFSLTIWASLYIQIDTTKFTNLSHWTLHIKKDGSTVYTKADWTGWDGIAYHTAAATGSDYTVVIRTSGAADVVSTVIPTALESKTFNPDNGTIHYYSGAQLTAGTLSGIFRLKITHDSDTFYSDWLEVCGFTGLTKYKISSDYDYGGIKYTDGYAQFIYKAATVRRAPEAEFEITGDKLNGLIIKEKTVSAVRYTLKMKITEPEWEALVHSINGTVEITDKDGKTYKAENIELRNPVWHGTNGIVEVSFVDSNNVNIWTRNNSAL